MIFFSTQGSGLGLENQKLRLIEDHVVFDENEAERSAVKTRQPVFKRTLHESIMITDTFLSP